MSAPAFTYGEVCAGVGGLSRGLERGGMSARLHVEIARHPRRVLRHHWPDVPLLSDLNAISGGRKMRAYMRRHFSGLTCLAGGTPCQDLSVAGKRAGIFGLRSSLYFRFVRLWKVLDIPYLLWENVAGALSSNQGADFALVLSAIVGGPVAVPRGGWSRAGVVAGPTGVAAWRCLDAQWFGVPQRRLRVFVLGARAGGVDPAAVLLEPEGVRGNPPTRGEAWEGSARGPGDGPQEASGLAFDALNNVASDVAHTLRSNMDRASGYGGVVSFDWQKGNDVSNVRPSTMNVSLEHTGTLQSSKVPAVLSFGWQNSPAQGDDVSHGSDAPMRTKTTPAILAYDTTQVTHPENRSNPQPGDPCHPLAAAAHAPLLVALAWDDECNPSADCAGALMAVGRGPVRAGVVVNSAPDVAGTLESRTSGGGFPGTDGACSGHVVPSAGIPRRLMPVECERLMGWDDGWTDVPDEKGKPASDAVRYKACGNGVVSNVGEWIGARLVTAHAEMLADLLADMQDCERAA